MGYFENRRNRNLQDQQFYSDFNHKRVESSNMYAEHQNLAPRTVADWGHPDHCEACHPGSNLGGIMSEAGRWDDHPSVIR